MNDGGARGRDHLHALARAPRPAGGDAEASARAYCARLLASLGFDVREEPFDYSDVPGRWGTSGSGIVAMLALPAVAWLAVRDRDGAALTLLLATLVVLAAAGTWMARRGVLAFPLGRRRGTNLVALPVEAGEPRAPAVWLLAHLDSKSQPVSMLARASGITTTVVVWVAALGLLIAGLVGTLPPLVRDAVWPWVGGLGALAALPVAASTVGGRSPGALDDASGVASVLEAARRLGAGSGVGVLLTSAEELGLAGARAWVAARGGSRRVPVLNCDGVDDEGELVLMHAGARPTRLLEAAAGVHERGGPRARPIRLIPGVLVDAVAFSDAGWETVTVSRGTARTLLRVHRETDDLTHLRGDGIDEAARLLAAMGDELARAARGEG